MTYCEQLLKFGARPANTRGLWKHIPQPASARASSVVSFVHLCCVGFDSLLLPLCGSCATFYSVCLRVCKSVCVSQVCETHSRARTRPSVASPTQSNTFHTKYIALKYKPSPYCNTLCLFCLNVQMSVHNYRLTHPTKHVSHRPSDRLWMVFREHCARWRHRACFVNHW